MTAEEIFNQFRNKHIVVFGDVMLDVYRYGKVNRISPEAPVPILSFEREESRVGGAANVALNLHSLGAKVSVFSIVGNDASGMLLRNLLKESGILTDAIFIEETKPTTVKTRYISGGQQILRVDTENVEDVVQSLENQMLESLKELSQKTQIDAIIFEDYNKGLLTEKLIESVIQFAKENHIPIAVDPKKKHFLNYRGVSLFKPNLKELQEGLSLSIDPKSKSSLKNAVVELQTKLNNELTLLTLSENGVAIASKEDLVHFPAHVRSIADVSGAGDTVIAVATLTLVSGGSLEQIAAYSNLAGGLVCEQSGVVSINKNQLLSEIKKSEI
ncbi:MAG: hypothetical protein RL264_2901 [Bacteroidota bacterium]